VKWTAYIDDDGAIIFRGRSEYLDGQDGRPLGEGPLERVRPGEEFAGKSFEEWHQFLKARGRAASLKV
jgi:hypothetical protein